MKQIVHRRASRLILFDGRGRVLLLLHAGADGQPFWAPPGGGLEDSETFEEAARREAYEELGMTPTSMRRLWEQTTDYLHADRMVRQHECFFLIEGALAELSSNTQQFHAQEGILEMRWWTPDEIDVTTERIFPEGLIVELGKIPT